jgi:hypothetical protein
MSLYCASCWTQCDDEAEACPCGCEKLLHASIYIERRDAEADRIEQMWEAYHQMKAAEATYSEGCLTRRQAS